MNKKELGLLIVFVALFVTSLYGISRFGIEGESIPVVALDEYLMHEGVYYQRTLSVVTLIDRKLIPVSTHYQGRPLYKETNAKIPARLLWPLDQEVYTIFVRTTD